MTLLMKVVMVMRGSQKDQKGQQKDHLNDTYVTEYWKTDHVRTFGQLLFIGPANSHTHTLPVHCCINGLS